MKKHVILLVGASDSGFRGLDLAGSLCCVVFLAETLNNHSVSLHPGVQMGSSELLGELGELLKWLTNL